MKVIIEDHEHEEIKEKLMALKLARYKYKQCRKQLARKYGMQSKTIRIFVEEKAIKGNPIEEKDDIIYTNEG